MQIVINIPEEDYERLKEYKKAPLCSLTSRTYEAIANGTPLPKGHGRLIDADDLRLDIIGHKYSNNFCEEHNIDWSINLGMLNILFADAPTIIDADKSEREG